MSEDDVLDLDSYEPPSKVDFRRVGRGKVPMVIDPTNGKRIRYRRTSSAGKVLDDDAGLTDWRLRTMLVGAAHRPELLAKVSVLDPEQNKAEIRDIGEECLVAGKGQARAIQGEAIHAMLDHVDLGHDWIPAPHFQSTIDAYKQMLELYGLVPIDVEIQCVNDRYRLAGTLDRRYRTTKVLTAPDGTIIPIGSVLVGDTKTGRTLEYASGTYTTQEAGYVDSLRYDVTTDERSPFDPPSHPHWGIIVHAVPENESCEMYWVDIDAGRDGLKLAQSVWEWRRRSDLLTAAVAPLRLVPPNEPREASTEPREPRAESLPTAGAADTRAAVQRAWMRERVKAVAAVPNAARALQRQWPMGMPGFKKSNEQTQAQLDELGPIVRKLELEYEIHPEPATLLLQEWFTHSRFDLVTSWIRKLDHSSNAIIQCLLTFGNVDEAWSDTDLDTALSATFAALGMEPFVFDDADCAKLLSAAFALQSGTAMMMEDENGNAVVRFNVHQARE